MNSPSGLALDRSGGRLFVADRNNNRILTFDLTRLTSGMAASDIYGQANLTSGAAGSASTNLDSPTGLAYDPVSNKLLIAAAGALKEVAVPLHVNNVTVSSVTSGTATIQWTSDANSDSQIEFGPTLGYGQVWPLSTTRVQNHAVTLTGLLPKTIYHFRVYSQDASGNLDVSVDYTLTTT